MTHLLSDLEGGRFDGAWLAQNFESLRPEAVFKKYDDLFAHQEAERERFLKCNSTDRDRPFGRQRTWSS